MNYFEHHIGDYDADTAHLTWAEDMAYTRLLRLYYRREKPIPVDINEACRLVRAATKEQRKAVADVMKEFFVLADDGWHQGRCDAELARYLKKVEHNREVGKLGGRPRKPETQTKPTGLSAGSKTEPDKNPPQSPVPSPIQPPLPTAVHPLNPSAPSVQKKAEVAVAVLLAEGFDAETADDFIAHKRRIKAPLTARAWSDHLAESRKAGWSPLNAAIKVMAKSWKGFEAKYVANEPTQRNGNHAEPAWRTEQRERNEAFLGPAAARRTSATVIDLEASDATARLVG